MVRHVNGQPPPSNGLLINALPFHATANGHAAKPLLTASQRRRLLAIATRLRLPARTTIYREGDALAYIFVVGEGVVKSFRELPSGKRRVVGFWFSRDVFGLAEHGRYVNTTKTVTASTLYRIPYEALTTALRRDADLEFRFLCKATQALRQAQRHSIVVGRRDAAGRLAMFLSTLEREFGGKPGDSRIALPMSRTDIAEYLGLSLEAVSRAARSLTRQGIVAFDDRHRARVTNRSRFESVVAAV